MRFSQPKTASQPRLFSHLALLALALAAAPAWSDLQTGRDARGTLWISDQGLPAGVRTTLTADINVATLPQTAPGKTGSTMPAMIDPQPTNRAAQIEKTRPTSPEKDKATCDGLGQRYENARSTLSKAEQDKASGKVLMPESGLINMRQNLATLERLRALCP